MYSSALKRSTGEVEFGRGAISSRATTGLLGDDFMTRIPLRSTQELCLMATSVRRVQRRTV